MKAKGLESLIPKKSLVDTVPAKGDIFFLKVGEIKPNPYQPRKTFSEDNLSSLARSIKNYGILEPLIVAKRERKTPQGLVVDYQLIAGERRLSAAKMLGLKEVPVIIKKLGDREKLEVSLVENIQREDLNPIEKAEAFQQLMKKFHLSLGKVARIWGKSKGAVSNSLRLLNLPQDIQDGLKKDRITEGHAKIIAGLKTKEQEVVYRDVLTKGLNVRETERLVRQYKTKKERKGKNFFSIKNRDIENSLDKIKKNFYLEKINISSQGKTFKITLVFPSLDKLKKFIHRLLS